MILKDMYCDACGVPTEMLVDSSTVSLGRDCESCGKSAIHRSRCTGGTRKRWRCQDWDGYDFEGHIQPMGVEAKYMGSGEPVIEKDGSTKTDRLRDGLDDRRGHRRDYYASARRRRRGQQTIYVDQGRKNA